MGSVNAIQWSSKGRTESAFWVYFHGGHWWLRAEQLQCSGEDQNSLVWVEEWLRGSYREGRAMVNRWMVRPVHQDRRFKDIDLRWNSVVNILSLKCLYISKMPNLMSVVFVSSICEWVMTGYDFNRLLFLYPGYSSL